MRKTEREEDKKLATETFNRMKIATTTNETKQQEQQKGKIQTT